MIPFEPVIIRFIFSVGLLMQTAPPAAVSGSQPSGSVPFVGCKSDWQTGPLDAPRDTRVSVVIGSTDPHELAYYRSAMGIGVLAPRGWECFGTYGSSGETLYVTPEPMDSKKVLSALRSKFTGAAIQVSRRFGDTSGRFSVAEMIARVFPAYKQFVTDVMGELDRPPRHVAVRAVPVRQAQVQGGTGC